MIQIRSDLLEELKAVCVQSLPGKAYGLIGGRHWKRPQSLFRCRTNLRQESRWKRLFESYGQFYRDPDRGFVIDSAEYLRITEAMDQQGGQQPVGVFHSHRCLCAEPSQLDRDFHADPSLICYIVSVRMPRRPEVRAFQLQEQGFVQIPFEVLDVQRRNTA